MLICKNCNIEYEEGKKFCKHCGEPLVPKEESMSTQKKVNKTEEGNSDGKLICPNCKIVYEFGSSCIQCGAALVRQGPPEAKEEPKTTLKTESEEKPPPVQTSQKQQSGGPQTKLICPDCKIIYERGDSCVRCGSGLVSQTEFQEKEKPKSSDTEVSLSGLDLDVGTGPARPAQEKVDF